MQEKNLFERLTETHPDLEIWWDSSPLIYEQFCRKIVEATAPEHRDIRKRQFERLYNEATPERSLFRGVTTNPPLSLQAIEADPPRWEKTVDQMIREEPGLQVETLFWKTYRYMVRAGAEKYRKVFEASQGRFGYISGQVDPRACHDPEKMLAMAMDLASLAPNVMIKVPGTREGYWVIEELTARGIATNNTLSFIVPQILAAAEAARKGLARAKADGVSLARWRAVITHMSSRFTLLGDLDKEAKEKGIRLEEADIRWAELALFKKMCRLMKENGYPSKMLICSMKTGPNTPAGKQLWHLQKLAGADVVFTCPPPLIEEVLTKGYDDVPLSPDGMREEVPRPVLDKLLKLPYFRSGYEEDGVSPAGFNDHAALKKTKQQHIQVTEKMVEFVRGRLAASTPAQKSAHVVPPGPRT